MVAIIDIPRGRVLASPVCSRSRVDLLITGLDINKSATLNLGSASELGTVVLSGSIGEVPSTE